VSATCPNGHASATTDYCDQCGAPIAPGPSAAPTIPPPPPTAVLQTVEEVDTSAAELAEPCPRCAAPRSGDDRYCEQCGHDFLAPEPSAGAAWEAVASADRGQFDRVAPPGLEFPDRYSDRRFPLNGGTVRIGRSRGRAGETVPEIDLAGDPQDPGVSHLHAELVRQDDGGYAVRDLGSTNGTTINDDPRPVSTETAVRLAPGDRIRLGAWTSITVRPR
jgi:hypothetical protein